MISGAAGSLNMEIGSIIDVSTNSSAYINTSNGLGLLFDTFVPISSILTIFIVVAFALPLHEWFGLFWLIWWLLAVCISLLGANDDDDDNNQNKGGLFGSSSPDGNQILGGMIVLLGFPLLLLVILFVWWKQEKSSSSSSSSSSSLRLHGNNNNNISNNRSFAASLLLSFPRIRPIRGFVLEHVPLWSMVLIHVYRLDGLSVVEPFWNGRVPKFVGYQTILLDAIIGITAIPLTYLLYIPTTTKRRKRNRASVTTSTSAPWNICRRAKGSQRQRRGQHHYEQPWFLRDALWFWNSLGLYDLCSAFVVFVLNTCGVGGPTITQPPLLPTLGKHPFPLLLLFQVPLAIAVHVLMLTHGEELLRKQAEQAQKSRDSAAPVLPTTNTA